MQGFPEATILVPMQMATLRLLTWGTIVGAVLSAVWLATLAPQRPFGATLGEAGGGSFDDFVLPDAVTRAGHAASAATGGDTERATATSGTASGNEHATEGQGKQFR